MYALEESDQSRLSVTGCLPSEDIQKAASCGFFIAPLFAQNEV
jgi:hypothetical protein